MTRRRGLMFRQFFRARKAGIAMLDCWMAYSDAGGARRNCRILLRGTLSKLGELELDQPLMVIGKSDDPAEMGEMAQGYLDKLGVPRGEDEDAAYTEDGAHSLSAVRQRLGRTGPPHQTQ